MWLALPLAFAGPLPAEPQPLVVTDGLLREVRASTLALSPAQRDALAERGFVRLADRRFYSFAQAYEEVYHEDLPVFVSADSVLHAVHRTYDDTLETLERARLVEDLGQALTAMRRDDGRLAGFPPEVREDVATWLQVASELLAGEPAHPLAVAATAAAGPDRVDLFGRSRDLDFSQFTPRGHYVGGLEPYFRAMIWLARVDVPVVEIDPATKEEVLHRRGLLTAMALERLREGDAARRLAEIDRVVRQFVGPTDGMEPDELDALLAGDGLATPDEVARRSDARILAALRDAPRQRIIGELTIGGIDAQPLGYALFGQRYAIDSHTLSAVVYANIPDDRMMPDPLDVAYAALGNDRALPLLEGVGGSYADALQARRRAADALPAAWWDQTLYTRWLAALRALSPAPGAGPTNEAWQRRILGAQLASWAELRHDTILYVKQSYTSMALCAFPDAWVEPNPAFWGATAAYAQAADEVVASLDLPRDVADHLRAPQQELARAATILGDMAARELRGEPFTAQQLGFVNEAVVRRFESAGCTSVLEEVKGWYPRLFLDPLRSAEYDPTIADVHTQPTDPAGNPVGKVLHVATSGPMMMAVAVETCNGPRVFLGPASSYHEVVTDGFQRLDDQAWSGRAQEAPPVEWMADLDR